MNLGEFAQKKRLTAKKDEDGILTISGKNGEVFDHGDGKFGVLVSSDPNFNRWKPARKQFSAAGMTISQNGDREGIALFDPTNKDQTKLALKQAGIKSKKIPTPAQLEALARIRAGSGAKGQKEGAEISPGSQQAFLDPGDPHLSGGSDAL